MAGIRERLVQLTVRARNFLAGDLKPGTDAMKALGEEGRRLRDVLAEAGRARGLVRTLRDTEGATGSLERAWHDAQATLEDLTREVGDSEQATAGQRIALREARRSADEAKSAYDRSQRAIKNLRAELKALNVDTGNLGSEEDRLTAEIKQNKQAVDDNREAIKQKRIEEKRAADVAQEHASRVDAARGALASGAKQVLAFAAAFVGLNALMGAVGRGLELLRTGIVTMLQTGDQFEGLQTRMNALMGSVAAGEAATAWVKDFAKRTPLELQEVTDAFAQLQAYGVDPMNGTLQALVDQNEKLGGGMERLGGIIGAVGQAYAKQKLQTEEILQLVERGVPVWDMLSKVTGKNAADLQDLASKGRLGRDVLSALVKEIGLLSAGAAESNMDRLSGIISNLKDQATDFYNRIANAGALEYVKGQFKQLSDTINRMAADGSLDALAQGLSKAFIQGVEWVKGFARELVKVDFKGLTNDSAAWLSSFGQHLDDARLRLEAFWAPFRTLGNTITGGLSQVAASFIAGAAQIVSVAEELGKVLPDKMGGQALVEKSQSALQVLTGLYEGFSQQAQQDVADIGAALEGLGGKAEESADRQGAAAASAAAETAASWDDAVSNALDRSESLRVETLRATLEGQQAIADMAGALDLINTANSVQQLDGLRAALLDAFQAGKLSQEEYAQATGVLSGRIKELQGAATGAADGVSDLEEKLGDLKSVQDAISNAKTDVDINNIRAALRKLYNDGSITASQYSDELKKTSDRQKELKQAVGEGSKAQRDKNEADKDAIVTSEQLRQESGKRMEAERKAGDQAMQDRRKGSEEAKRDMGAMEGFFGGVLTRAREPLAAMSAAALDAFNALRGIKAADVTIDTSSLDATSASLARVAKQLGQVKEAAASPMLSSLGKWQLETQRASLETQAAFLGQKASLQGLMARYESGSMTLKGFVAAAKAAKSGMGLLDDSDLSSLESAIKSAQEQMKQMGESTRSTLEGLQDELDGLQGRQEDIERRKYASRRRDLQEQLAEAKATGDTGAISNATRALGMLRQIEDAAGQQRQQEEQKKRMDAQAESKAAPAATTAPAKVIRLETTKGKSVEVSVGNDQDETNLLSILEDAGLRAL